MMQLKHLRDARIYLRVQTYIAFCILYCKQSTNEPNTLWNKTNKPALGTKLSRKKWYHHTVCDFVLLFCYSFDIYTKLHISKPVFDQYSQLCPIGQCFSFVVGQVTMTKIARCATTSILYHQPRFRFSFQKKKNQNGGAGFYFSFFIHLVGLRSSVLFLFSLLIVVPLSST